MAGTPRSGFGHASAEGALNKAAYMHTLSKEVWVGKFPKLRKSARWGNCEG